MQQLSTMKSMKGLKETLTVRVTRRQSSPLLHDLHALHGWWARTILHHEEHAVLEGNLTTLVGTMVNAHPYFMPFMPFMVDSLGWRLGLLNGNSSSP